LDEVDSTFLVSVDCSEVVVEGWDTGAVVVESEENKTGSSSDFVLLVTATGSDLIVLVLFLGDESADSTFVACFSASCSCSSPPDCLAISAILSISFCLRSFSTSTIPNTFPITRNSDTRFEFYSLIFINIAL